MRGRLTIVAAGVGGALLLLLIVGALRTGTATAMPEALASDAMPVVAPAPADVPPRLAFTEIPPPQASDSTTSSSDVGDVIALDGTGRRKIAQDSVDEESPAYSPDGSRIAYSRSVGKDGEKEIVVADADGSHRRTLQTDHLTGDRDTHPAWSPNGTRIAFTKARQADTAAPMAIYVATLGQVAEATQPAVLKKLSHPRHEEKEVRDDEAAWSPDGQRIAVARQRPSVINLVPSTASRPAATRVMPAAMSSSMTVADTDIWVLNADSGDAVALTDPSGSCNPGCPSLVGRSPSWSPDGSRLAIARVDGGTAAIILAALADADNNAAPDVPEKVIGVTAFSKSKIGDREIDVVGDPAWSPDGTEIAFAGVAADPNRVGAYAIDSRLADASLRGIVTDSAKGSAREPAWQPSTDLELALSAPPQINQGDTTTVAATVKNIGGAPAAEGILTFTLPAGLTAQPPVPPGCTSGGTTLTCQTGALAKGGAAAVSVVVMGTAPGSQTVLATATTRSPDVHGGNNARSVTIDVVPRADLLVTAAVSTNPVLTNEPVTVTFRVTNNGPQVAEKVELATGYPAGGARAVVAPVEPGCRDDGTGCTLDSLAPEGSVSYVVTLVYADAVKGRAEAMGSSATEDPNPANNSAAVDLEVLPRADLAVVVDLSQPSVPTGQPVTATFTVTNQGPQPAQKVELTTGYPAGGTRTAVDPVPGCRGDGTGCTLDRIGPNETVRYAVTLTYPDPLTGRVEGAVTSTTADPDSENNTDAKDLVVLPSADVSVAVSLSQPSVLTGQPVTATFTVHNNGPQVAGNVELATGYPPGGTRTVPTPPPGCRPDGTGCALETLAVGATVTYDVILAYPDPVRGPVRGTVRSTTTDPNQTNDSDAKDLEVRPRADLAVELAVTGSPARTEQPMTATFTVRNTGPQPAENVRLTTGYPAGGVQTAPAPRPAGCREDGTGCTIRTLPVGGRVTYVASLVYGTPVRGLVSGTVAADTADPEPSDNTASAPVEVVAAADVAVTVAVRGSPALAGRPVVATFTVTNGGPQPATAVRLRTAYPPGGTRTAGAPVPAGCASDGTGCTLPVLAPGASVRYPVTLTFGSPLRGQVVASVESATGDPNRSNNRATAPIEVVATADVAVEVTLAGSPAVAGHAATATFIVRNAGPQPARAVTLATAYPPGGAQQATGTLPAGCRTDGSGCALGTLPAGGSAAYAVRLTYPLAGGGPVRGTVSATPDPALSNNDGAADLVVLSPKADVAVRIGLSPNPAAPGAPVSASVDVTNHGPDPAAAVTLGMGYPKGATVVAVPACLGGMATCPLGTLPPGATEHLSVRLTPTTAGGEVNAVVSTDTDDPAPANNLAAVRLTVTQPHLALLPELGPPGLVTLAFGQSFPPGAQVALTWQPGINAGAGPVRVQPDGTFAVPVLVLRRDELGERQLVASGTVFAAVRASFLVVPRSLSPPRFLGRD